MLRKLHHFFVLEHSRRKLRTGRQVPPMSTIFSQCQCTARQPNLSMSNNKCTMNCVEEHNVAPDQWCETSVKGLNLETFYELLMQGDVTLSVNGSFFPDKSSLTSAHYIIAHKERKLGSGDFTSTVAANYRNAFTAEPCGVLAICKLIEYAAQRRTTDRLVRVKIVSDCVAVINFLPSTRSTISNKATLHQIKREMLLIKEQVNLKLTPVKVAAHRDETTPFNKLIFLEKVNTMCDMLIV